VTNTPTDERGALVQQLHSLAEEARSEMHRQGYETKHLGRLGTVLAVLATLGSGTAGAVVAATQTLSGAARTIVAIVAFIGAGISGVAGAVRAPQRAQGAQGRWLELRSLSRRLEAVTAGGLTSTSIDQLKALIDETLDRLDQIEGARDSATLRLLAQPSTSTPPAIGIGGAPNR
jgi:hypothetical protein